MRLANENSMRYMGIFPNKFLSVVFSVTFFISKHLFAFNNKKIVFLCMHDESFEGSLRDLYEAFVERDQDFSYYVISRPKFNRQDAAASIVEMFSFCFKGAKRLGTSKYIFMNDRFAPLSWLNFNKHAVLVQLWHTNGVLKKFGYDVYADQKTRKLQVKNSAKYTYVVASSENTAPIFANALGVPTEKVLTLGSVRTDRLFTVDRQAARREFEKKFPETAGKKIVLCAPTYRDEKDMDAEIVRNYDPAGIAKRLGNRYALLFKLHPCFRNCEVENDGSFIDVTDYRDINELTVVSDILLTDYSSLVNDFAIMGKPIVLFPYDLDEFTTRCRGFYFDYSFVPGEVAKNQNDIIRLITEENFDYEKIDEYGKWQQPYDDGKSSERLVGVLM